MSRHSRLKPNLVYSRVFIPILVLLFLAVPIERSSEHDTQRDGHTKRPEDVAKATYVECDMTNGQGYIICFSASLWDFNSCLYYISSCLLQCTLC